MAVETTDVTLGDLSKDPLKFECLLYHRGNRHELFPAHVIKGQNDRVRNLAIHTAFVCQVGGDGNLIAFPELFIALAKKLWLALVINAPYLLLASFTNRLQAIAASFVFGKIKVGFGLLTVGAIFGHKS